MALNKIYNLLFIIILAEGLLCRPIQDTAGEVNNKVPTISPNKLLLSAIENVTITLKHYSANAANATQYLLKDETLVANNRPEVLQFKSKLNIIWDKHNVSTDNIKSIYETWADLANLTNHYYQLPEDELTQESKFLIELLNKYNCRNIAMDLFAYFEKFFAQIMQIIEENKNDIKISLKDSLMKFLTLNDMQEKIHAFIELAIEEYTLDMAEESLSEDVKGLSEQLMLLARKILVTLPKQYNANAANASQYLLNDERLKSNHNSEIVEFKNRLNTYLSTYDPTTKRVKIIHNSLAEFNNLTNHYLQLPKDKLTEETKLIIELIDKYNCGNILRDMLDNLESSFEKLVELFEELKNKENVPLEKPVLEWLEKFKTLSELKEKYESFLNMVIKQNE